jgi:CPA1 family monovalent cation:H+ antiporter
MTLFEIVAVLLVLSALFSYLNHRFIRLPTTIGVMAIALAMSLGLVLAGRMGLGGLQDQARVMLNSIDFDEAVLHGMLGFLLFAGALHIKLGDLAEQKWAVGLLATIGVVVSTGIIGLVMWGVFAAAGMPIHPLHCFLFGALISPTDPIAVLGILKSAGAPKSLEIKIAGESLFNDGIGVVVFLVLLAAATRPEDVSAAWAVKLLLVEAVGGAALGLVLGYVTFLLLRSVDNYSVELLLTLALTTGGYALAERIHVSAPIMIVVAGLLIGNYGRVLAMSDKTREHLDTFWELVDEILNAVLFLLIGLEVLVLEFSGPRLLAGVAAVPVVLAARWVSVGGAVAALRKVRAFEPGTIRILTWGGLRGGISVALVLSLPADESWRDIRDGLLVVTYVVVVFSILAQGLTMSGVIRRLVGTPAAPAPPTGH